MRNPWRSSTQSMHRTIWTEGGGYRKTFSKQFHSSILVQTKPKKDTMQVIMCYVILTLLLEKLLFLNLIIIQLQFQLLGINIIAKSILNQISSSLIIAKRSFSQYLAAFIPACTKISDNYIIIFLFKQNYSHHRQQFVVLYIVTPFIHILYLYKYERKVNFLKNIFYYNSIFK